MAPRDTTVRKRKRSDAAMETSFALVTGCTRQLLSAILVLVIAVVLAAVTVPPIAVDAFATQSTHNTHHTFRVANTGFVIATTPRKCPENDRPSVRRHSVLRESNAVDDGAGADDDDDTILSSASRNAAMSETSRLSHAMLKVPSVDAAVAFWESKGGRVVNSRSNGETNGEAELLSAFVKIGCVGSSTGTDDNDIVDDDDDDDPSFSLEIVKGASGKAATEDDHHGLSYLGLSMLLKYQGKNPLLDIMTGQSTADNEDPSVAPEKTTNNRERSDDEQQFPIKYVASAPGDGFAQLVLLSDNKLAETCDFYTTVLGMHQKAQDQRLLCLRYDSKPVEDNKTRVGVATTLVFENRPQSGNNDDGTRHINNFDHLAIKTASSIRGLYRNILEENASTMEPVDVYMKPTPMFGSIVLGLVDPNGYKVVVFGENK